MSSEVTAKLKISVGADHLQLFLKRCKDARFEKFQQRVFVRDAQTCQFCDFRAPEGMLVANVDGNYRHNKLSNLLTSCPLCLQCTFLDGVGLPGFVGGVLIYLPEIGQSELNSMVHVLFQSILSEDENAGQSRNIYRTLRLRSQLIEKQLGEDLSSPVTYSRMLIDADPKQAAVFNRKICASMRFLPDVIGCQPFEQGCLISALSELKAE